MRVVSAVAADHGVEVPIPVFFADPTVEGLAAAVRRLRDGHEEMAG
jgi:hypothetical protein